MPRNPAWRVMRALSVASQKQLSSTDVLSDVREDIMALRSLVRSLSAKKKISPATTKALQQRIRELERVVGEKEKQEKGNVA